MSREIKALGYRKITARPCHHAQNELAIEAFKKAVSAFRVGQAASIRSHASFWAVDWSASLAMNHAR
jgi:hypothetical protein